VSRPLEESKAAWADQTWPGEHPACSASSASCARKWGPLL